MAHTAPSPYRRSVHPHRFMMWLSMASMVMLFTGFTSAYIVKHADTNVWNNVELPSLFWVSTTAILASSVALALGVRAFKRRALSAYRGFLALATILGGGFIAFQVLAWRELLDRGLPVGTEVAADFLYVISGAHFLHVAGGLVALAVVALRAWTRYREPEDLLLTSLDHDRVPAVELVATYWHFVDLLWIYLFVFFIANT
jgi:cytochrome c oxidase subunit 3